MEVLFVDIEEGLSIDGGICYDDFNEVGEGRNALAHGGKVYTLERGIELFLQFDHSVMCELNRLWY